MATSEQFSLRWTNFHSNITAGFHDLLEANDMVDVTLAVEGHFLQAHKIVLSICSPYFKQLFRINPCKHPIVILKDVSFGNMKDILEFMYLGEVNVLRENLSAFLRTAELLQVKGLTGDDSSDTSSKKDDKTDSICDNDDDDQDYTQLMESDSAVLMPQYPPEVPSPPQQKAIVPPSNVKRLFKQTPTTATNISSTASVATSNNNSSFKKFKQDATSTPIPLKMSSSLTDVNDACQLTNDEETEYIEMPAKMDQPQCYEKDTGVNIKKEPLYDSSASFNNSMGDGSLQDHDANARFSMDSKQHVFCPYCYRKFVNRYNLKIHIRDKHDTSDANLECIICGKAMRNKSCLRVHMYHHRKRQLKLEGTV
ncbi:modifier of mdg4-like isoform X2 [Onthophagus taurus]|uniref:modifier of mdg4-like isoform X2 n=1 Tax=Onthophagus taurus TaxID=166361 RepID=UPI000C1FF6C7|nr:modifier of mdg4-like isoform X2 [Onthophagus taurus]